jgi:dephospho-CoA kinase
MLRVGLTGGIACGKSMVAAMLARRGAHVLNADTLAHDLYSPGTPTHAELVRRFGREILSAEGAIDRKKLANLVFPSRIDELNAVVHPAVIDAQDHWIDDVARNDPNAIAVVEAALLLEAGAEKGFDKVVVVTCDPEQKALRYALRAGVSPEVAQSEVERRSAAQMSDAEKSARADFVIDNSGSVSELESKVGDLWRKLCEAPGVSA